MGCLVAWLVLAGQPDPVMAQAIERSPATVQLAEGGTAAWPLVISPQASERGRAAAETLAGMLGRISGAAFTVQEGDGSRGIAVGQAADFPDLGLADRFQPDDALQRQDYLLRSHAEGLLLIGATDLAVELAVWDLLHRLGYRQFFPGDVWEVVPKESAPTVAVDTFESPDFQTRWMWYGHGFWRYNRAPYEAWCIRNRAVPGFSLRTSHSYQAVIRRNQAVFDAHPEYLALVGGERRGPQFCLSNADLRRLIIEKHALAHFQNHPEDDSVSLEPADGSGWCECAPCAAMGSISDRVVTLANEAAQAVQEAFPGRYVGLLAYHEHSPPPSIQVHPHVIVKVQTHFLRGGHTFDDLVEGWQAQGARIGVGDYYSVFAWDQSRPGLPKASNLHHIRTSIPRFHRQGARFFMAESSDLWGALGLGHYVASRLLWDVQQAEQVDRILADFFDRAFGPAREPMEGFFRLIYQFDQDHRRPLIRGDMVARMYRFLDEARRLSDNAPQVQARLDHLLLLTRYEELFQIFEQASGAARQSAFEALLQHAWRMRETMMIHAKPIHMHLARRMRMGETPPKERIEVDRPFEREELDRILAEGIAGTEPVELGFEPVDYSQDLVPARPVLMNQPAHPVAVYDLIAPQGRQSYHTFLEPDAELHLRISGGHIVHYRHLASNVQTSLYAQAHPILDEAVAMDQSVAPDGEEVEVVLKSPYEGLHRVEVWPPSNRAKAAPAVEGTYWTLDSSLDAFNQLSSRWSLYFYVPRGTTQVGGFASTAAGHLLDGSGQRVLAFSDISTPGFFSVPVPEGQDGRLWKFEHVRGQRALLTVPPYLARHGDELLLPREVVEAEAGR